VKKGKITGFSLGGGGNAKGGSKRHHEWGGSRGLKKEPYQISVRTAALRSGREKVLLMEKVGRGRLKIRAIFRRLLLILVETPPGGGLHEEGE